MSGRTAYLDASAITRLVVDAPGSAEATAFLRGMSNRVTSVVSRTCLARGRIDVSNRFTFSAATWQSRWLRRTTTSRWPRWPR